MRCIRLLLRGTFVLDVRTILGAIMSDVHLQQITHRYATEDVLKDIDLTIPHGSLFTLLGPSGCGKTTLLRILAGFITPTEGRVIIGDNDVTDLGAEKRNMGVVFQNYALFPNMTVRQNIMYGLKVRKVRGDEAQQRCDRYMELAGLEHYADRNVQELSGGQQQRVAITRALVIEPQMLLLDEPMSNLDVALRVKMREEIRSIQQETGVTTLFITHDQQEALSISDRVAVMRDGVVLQEDTPENVYNHPSCDFVATFVGTSNRIGDKLVRPEQLRLADDGPGIPVRVAQVRFVGPYYEYSVESERDGSTYRVLDVNRAGICARQVGQRCILAVDEPSDGASAKVPRA